MLERAEVGMRELRSSNQELKNAEKVGKKKKKDRRPLFVAIGAKQKNEVSGLD